MPDKLLLVVSNSDCDSPPPKLDGDGEQEFQLSGTKDLSLDGCIDPVAALDYLAHCVARCPLDLASHVRRIFLCARMNLQEGLYGALLDLFIVLTGRGLSLRRRLLYGSKPQLKQEHFAALERSLGVDAGASGELPLTSRSMLYGGNTGSTRLVVATELTGKDEDDPLIIARDHIEFSQLDEARSVLEQAIMLHPLRKELQLELVDLYQSMRDKENFRRMLENIDLSRSPVPEAWKKAMQFFQVNQHEG
ncbi:MAG: hypothetical protein ABFS02_09545 [Pseudomonadota bacterium]